MSAPINIPEFCTGKTKAEAIQELNSWIPETSKSRHNGTYAYYLTAIEKHYEVKLNEPVQVPEDHKRLLQEKERITNLLIKGEKPRSIRRRTGMSLERYNSIMATTA